MIFSLHMNSICKVIILPVVKVAILSVALLFAGCGADKQDGSTNVYEDDYIAPPDHAKGGKFYGGTLSLAESEYYQTLFPQYVVDAVSEHIVTQVYEGLVKFDPITLEIRPCIAERWEIDSSGTVYTFHLKDNVYFHSNKCFDGKEDRKVTASDFKYSFELLSTAHKENTGFNVTLKDKLVGANEYYEASKNGKPDFDLKGIKVIDNRTLQLTLVRPSSIFLYILANPITSVVSRKAFEAYGSEGVIGTGPYRYSKLIKEREGDIESPVRALLLRRNHEYHRFDTLGNQLPFIDSVLVNFIDTKENELNAFYAKELDMIYGLPPQAIKSVVEDHITDFIGKSPKYILERQPQLSTNFYVFNTTVDIFKDKRIRQALSYGINRKRIIERALKGEAQGPAIYGITPPSLRNYDVKEIKGYAFDLEKSKQLLAEAGYPDGEGFPVIHLILNSGGTRNTAVALEIQNQLREYLNINMEMEIVPFPKKIELAQLGKFGLVRSGWIADFPSPENFLRLFYGKDVPQDPEKPSYPNTSRYTNSEFDRLFEKGVQARTHEESVEFFKQAEQVMINDAPAIILWYGEKYRLLQANVKDFYYNPKNYRDLAIVYLTPKAAPVGDDQQMGSEK